MHQKHSRVYRCNFKTRSPSCRQASLQQQELPLAIQGSWMLREGRLDFPLLQCLILLEGCEVVSIEIKREYLAE
jgi:hypothetical protein